jgi:DNA-binding NarL/FixJ family response regulator
MPITTVTDRPLTFRWKEVLDLFAKNDSNKDIALTLGTDDATAKTHVKNIYVR